MYKLSKQASLDLDDILDYSFIKFGENVTLGYHQSLEKCFKTLAENPDFGLETEHIRKDYLSFEHCSHIIFYKKTGSDILIVRILHKSMNVSGHLN